MFSSISWLAVVSTIVLFIQGAHASPAAFIVEKASLRVLSPASQVGPVSYTHLTLPTILLV